MPKSIKKSYNFLIILAAIIILLPSVLFSIVRTPVVQTYMIKEITSYISGEINSTVSVGKINFSFFNKLVINDILIKDQHNDTLLFTPEIKTGIMHLNLRKNVIKLGKAEIIRPVVGFVIDSTGLMNLTWYLNMFQKSKDSTGRKSSAFYINQIDISDARFSLRNQNTSKGKTMLDFHNLNLTGINAIIENLKIENDSISLDIYNLGFRDSSGFTVQKMNSNLMLNKQQIIFRDVSLICDSSIINADHIGILADSASSFKRFTEEVKLDISLKKSLISTSDLRYFLPFIRDYNESVWLSGNVTGTISELKGRNVLLSFKDESYLDCNFDFSGLPDIENTFIFIDVNDLKSNSKDIEQIRIPGKGYIILPDALRKLGIVSFSGSFTGFTTDFVTYGKLSTNKGLISTDISFKPDESGRFKIKGLLKGSNIDLGSITGKPDLLGDLSMEANVDGYASSFKTFSAAITGRIDSIEINNYKYRNIALNGNFTDKTWDGNIKIEDKNIHMDLLGLFDFSRKLPEFDFTLNLTKADLHKLNIDKADTSSSLSMLLTANFSGTNIDNLDGEIKILNSNFRKFENKLEIYDFTIKTFTENNLPAISLRTDFIDANLKGRYDFASLGNIIKYTLASLMPVEFKKPKEIGKLNENNFVFDIKFKNTSELSKFFRTGIRLADNSLVYGSFFPDSVISVTGKTNMLALNNNILNDLSIEAGVIDTVLNVKLQSVLCNLSGLAELKDLNLNLDTRPDYFGFSLYWDNKDKVLNNGKIIANGTLTKNASGNKNSQLKVDLLPTEVFVHNNLWKINPAVIMVDSSSINIKKLLISNNENYYRVDGAISNDPSDTLQLGFNGLNISPLNNLYEKKVANYPNKIHLSLGGTLTGKILLTNIYKNFMFESDVKVNNFSLLESQYGDIKIGSVWNNTRKVAEINANNDLAGAKMFDIGGYYDPQTKKVNLNARADKLPIDVLNPLLKVFASGITGTASGKVNLTGEFSKPVLTGALFGEDATIMIDYLQTKYKFNDSIRFDKSGIRFNNIQVMDEKGNIASLNGTVYHKYFKDYSVDLTIRTNNCQVLNTKTKDNELFYGTGYASGVTTIKSKGTTLSFDISAKTGKDTKFYIPLNAGLSVSDNSFIDFVDANQNVKPEEEIIKKPINNRSKTSMDLNFDLEVTPDAEVQLILDSKAGDVMKGHGSGNLNISFNPKGEFKIVGDYIIEDGDYLFTLGSIFNKKFNVENGGKITFNGSVYDADIDIKAIYKLKASLYDIMPGMLPDAKLKERIPVECQLLLTGKLFNPIVGFDINLPTADEETKSYLKSMIKSDEEMSRQILFLLVMNSFYADPMAGTQQSTADISSATVGVTTTEMVSNQLSNWLSQISNDFDIGVVYRPGSTALPNSQEVQVALSTQLLNDKVTINGNFDVGGNQTAQPSATSSSGNSITGAFDVEFKITEKIRFKVFNRSNDNFYMNNGIQYTQGVSLFYRQDFNKLKELSKKADKGEMKKEEDTKIKKQ